MFSEPNFHHFLAKVVNVPVATASLYLGDGVAYDSRYSEIVFSMG